MYCQQCGNQSHGTQYCRVCGANLKLAPVASDPKHPGRHPWTINLGRKKTPRERREQHLTKGIVSLFSGAGLSVFLYFLSGALVLKLPPDVIAKIPFEIAPVVHVIWLLGLMPATAGIGHILAGLLIRPEPQPTRQLEDAAAAPRDLSITEHTTNLLP